MEIELAKHKRGQEPEFVYLNLTVINKLQGKDTLYLVADDKYILNESETGVADYTRIHKVVFLASCKIGNFPNEKLVAFYFDQETKYLTGFVLSDLSGYYNPKDMRLVDYKAYCDTCELTGETKLVFYEYYNKLKKDGHSLNTFLNWKNLVYNADQQVAFFDTYDTMG